MAKGGMSSLKHVVKRRVHLERSQPARRAKLGLLEKKSDYKIRAEAHHKKEKVIQALQRKAALKNPEEFNFKMKTAKLDKDGKVIRGHKSKMGEDELVLSAEQKLLMDSRNKEYITHRMQIDDKKIEKLKANLQMLSAEKKNKHLLFVDSDEEVDATADATAARLLNTDEVFLNRQFNRPTKKMLQTNDFTHDDISGEALNKYKEIMDRTGRRDKMARVRHHLQNREDRAKGKKHGLKLTEKHTGKRGDVASLKWSFKRQRWPTDVDPKLDDDYKWLTGTEWVSAKGTAYQLLKDGQLFTESKKECKDRDDFCKWTANRGEIMMLMPKGSKGQVTSFTLEGDGIGKSKKPVKETMEKLKKKDEESFKKIKLVSTIVAKTGRRSEMTFKGFAKGESNGQEDSLLAFDAYKILNVTSDAPSSDIKKAYRKLSISLHPDKGGDPEQFGLVRESYELLSDKEKRDQYDVGGPLLVHNVELAWKEFEGQKAQLQQQLDQVPKNHPQRGMAEAQFKQQTNEDAFKRETKQKMTSKMTTYDVPVDLKTIHEGGTLDNFVYERLIICKGCRGDPDAPECAECGDCPPEIRQVPVMGPFPGMVVGTQEKEVQSNEKCMKQKLNLGGLKIPKGAEEGTKIGENAEIGDQVPGRYPGPVQFRVTMKEDKEYFVNNRDLYGVLHLTPAEAIWGFKKEWPHFDGTQMSLSRSSSAPDGSTVKIRNKGLKEAKGKGRGDVYLRLKIDLPKADDNNPDQTITLSPKQDRSASAKITRESDVELREGEVWRRFIEAETVRYKKSKKQVAAEKGGEDSKGETRAEL